MRRFILTAVLCLMFTAPASAKAIKFDPADILLTCWTDNDTINLMKEAATIILKIVTETAILIDPYNRVQNGGLSVSEYFYTITIDKNTQFSKVGTIKVNRFTGRFSSHWQYRESGEGNFSKGEDIYGICIKASPRVF